MMWPFTRQRSDIAALERRVSDLERRLKTAAEIQTELIHEVKSGHDEHFAEMDRLRHRLDLLNGAIAFLPPDDEETKWPDLNNSQH